MVRIIQKRAVQAHAVPSRVMQYQAGFNVGTPSPVLAQEYDPDHLYPDGATVQNGMQGVEIEYYECRDCSAILREDELDHHVCEETT